MRVEQWPIDRVKPYPENPRQNAGIIDALAKSIARFGFRQPLVVDQEGVLIVGHARLQAARQLGLTEVPVHMADLTPERTAALRIADNRTREFAEWDFNAVRDELLELDADLVALSGFDLADEVLRQGWTPPPLTPLPTRDGGTAVTFTAEQWARVLPAIEKARRMDENLSAARALELICADALA